MNEQRIRILSDRKYALAVFVLLFIASSYFGTEIWLSSATFIGKILVAAISIIFFTISSLGLFTIFSKKFEYVTAHSKAETDHGIFLISDDKIQERSNPGKVIRYTDIESIVAIPNALVEAWQDENEYEYFLEISSQNGEKMLLMEEKYQFLSSFNKVTDHPVPVMLSVTDIDKRYGKLRLFFASLLFTDSPLRVTLWQKNRI